jgi:hypothetical protein
MYCAIIIIFPKKEEHYNRFGEISITSKITILFNVDGIGKQEIKHHKQVQIFDRNVKIDFFHLEGVMSWH